MAIFEGKDCLAPISKVGKIIIKEGTSQDALYTFCIPSYKRSKDLKEALDSVFDQKTKIPFNVLISDNNPDREDETELLIQTYYSNKDNLWYIKNAENLGMAGNWNRLILECKSEYMIMLHDDDVLFPFFLERIDNIRKIHPDLSALNTGKKVGAVPVLEKNVRGTGKVYKHTAKTDYCKFFFEAPTGCLLKVSDLKEVGGFDPETYPSIDYVCIMKLCLAGKIVLKTDEKLMFCRDVENTTARLETQMKWLDIDYNMKTELKELLGISNIMYKVTLWFELKMRLYVIKKLKSDVQYRDYKPGSKIFCVLYGLYVCYFKKKLIVV